MFFYYEKYKKRLVCESNQNIKVKTEIEKIGHDLELLLVLLLLLLIQFYFTCTIFFSFKVIPFNFLNQIFIHFTTKNIFFLLISIGSYILLLLLHQH